MSKNKNTKKRKRRIKYKNVFKFLLFVILIVFVIKFILNSNVSNIYISGNSYLKDQEIIKIAKLEDYPSIFRTFSFVVKKRLLANDMITSAKVHKKGTKIYIEVVENRPILYDSNISKLIMLDKTKKDGKAVTPYLVNYVPDTLYDKFIDCLTKVKVDVLNRISDIEYNPNSVDIERFYLTMTDGNYIYITLNNFTKVNNYIEMIKQFQGKKGILYLDAGEYFEIKE